MRYPVAIEAGSASTAFGVVVPDLPGCFSAGDTLDEAMANAEEAIELWIETALETGVDIPPPSTLGDIQARPAFAGWAVAVVAIDPAALDDTIERVNITIPRRLLHRLDQRAKAAGETRSGYIAKLALR
jgi:predicted RNase H-like HicB family nuclease